MAIVTKIDFENLLIRVGKILIVRPKSRTVYNSLDFKSLIVQDANSVEIDFFKVEFDETPQIGDEARIDNKKATGEYTMPDGNIWTFKDGKLEEIKVLEASLEASFKNTLIKVVPTKINRTVYKKTII